VTAARIRYHLNVRAVLYLTAASVVSALGVYFLWGFQETRVLASGLKQVRAFQKVGAAEKDLEGRERNYDLALRHLNQYLDSRPNDPDGLEIEGEILTARDDLPSAISVYEHLLRVETGGARAQFVRRRLAKLCIRVSNIYRYILKPDDAAKVLRYNAAEFLARKLIEKNAEAKPPVDDAESHRLLAMALEGQLRPDEPDKTTRELEVMVDGKPQTTTVNLAHQAISEYRKALALDPGDLVAAMCLAELYQKLKDPVAAKAVLDGLLKAYTNLVDVHRIRSVFFKNNGDIRAAADELDAAAKLAPGDLEIILMATENALRLDPGGIEEARRWLEKVPEQSRNDPRVFRMQGMVEYTMQDFDAAIRTWRKGLELSNAANAELIQWIALTQLELGRDDEAATFVTQYRRLVGDEDPILRLLEGMQDQHEGRYSRAIERLEWARARLPESQQPFVSQCLGDCQEKQGNLEEAEKMYRIALQLDPKSLILRRRLSRLLLARRPEEAAREIEQGLVSHPHQPDLLIALAQVKFREQRARAPERRNWSDFDEVIKRATAVVPQNTALILLHAERLALDAGLDQAAMFLKEVVEKTPQSPELARRLSEHLLGLGRTDQALQVVGKAMDPKAAGDRGVLRIQRANVLAALGQGREARSALIRDIGRLSPGDQDEVWGFLVLFCHDLGDPDASRSAYNDWTRQLPDDPRPKLALLEMEIAANDGSAIRIRLESLRPRDERGELTWRLAQARERLWERSNIVVSKEDRPSQAESKKKRQALLKEADTLVESVLHDIKIDPTALLLRAHILKEEDSIKLAEDTYRQAWARGNTAALLSLVKLLVEQRETKEKELEQLLNVDTSKYIDKIVSLVFLERGENDKALRIVEQSLSEKPGIQPWQIVVLDMLGEKEKAESVVRALAEQSGVLDWWLNLVRRQVERGQASVAEKTIAEIKRRVKVEQPELLEAECRRAAGDWPAADRAFSETLNHYPNVVKVQMRAAEYFQERGRNDRAQECLRRVLSQDPNDRVARHQLARLLAAQTERPDAWKEALELLGPERPGTDTPEDRLARATVLLRSGDKARMKEARALLEALAADLAIMDPRGVSARILLTRLLLVTSQPEQAGRVIEETALSGIDPESIALYGETLLQTGKFSVLDKQLKRLEKIEQGRQLEANLRIQMILKQKSSGQAAAAALEETYLERERSPGGETFGRLAFARLLGMGPDALEVAERLGRRLARHNAALSWMPARVLVNRGDRLGALLLCQAAAQSPGDPVHLREACGIAMEVAVADRDDPTMLEKADAVLAAAIARTPEADDLLIMKAMLDHLRGHFDEEIRHYRSVLARKPQHLVVLNNIAWSLSEGVQQPSEALGMIDDVIRIQGRNSNNIDTRGVILMRLGRHDEAIEELKWVVQTEPTGIHYYHLAHAYHKAGRTGEFRDTMEKLRQTGLAVTDLDTTERSDYQALMNP